MKFATIEFPENFYFSTSRLHAADQPHAMHRPFHTAKKWCLKICKSQWILFERTAIEPRMVYCS